MGLPASGISIPFLAEPQAPKAQVQKTAEGGRRTAKPLQLPPSSAPPPPRGGLILPHLVEGAEFSKGREYRFGFWWICILGSAEVVVSACFWGVLGVSFLDTNLSDNLRTLNPKP